MRQWQVKVSRTRNNIVKNCQGKSLTIGRVIKSLGLRGELWVEPYSDDSSRYEKLISVILEKPDGALLPFEVEEARIQKGLVVLKLSGVDDRTDADRLRGSFVTIGMEQIQDLDQDSYYIFELQGMEVFDAKGVYIGKVTQVDDYPSGAILVIKSETEEILLPAIKEFIVTVDTENRRLTVQLPEGLPSYPIKGMG
ncbi:MAG: ribosome maturation factor RimM [Candidatus Latescibacterota bacterium]